MKEIDRDDLQNVQEINRDDLQDGTWTEDRFPNLSHILDFVHRMQDAMKTS